MLLKIENLDKSRESADALGGINLKTQSRHIGYRHLLQNPEEETFVTNHYEVRHER
jgi:hypothetical protein